MVEGVRVGGGWGLLGVLEGCCPGLSEVLEDIENSITAIRTCMSFYSKSLGKSSDLGARVPFCLGFINCMILARRAFSDSPTSVSIAAAFRFKETGTVGVETRKTWFAMRVR